MLTKIDVLAKPLSVGTLLVVHAINIKLIQFNNPLIICVQMKKISTT